MSAHRRGRRLWLCSVTDCARAAVAAGSAFREVNARAVGAAVGRADLTVVAAQWAVRYGVHGAIRTLRRVRCTGILCGVNIILGHDVRARSCRQDSRRRIDPPPRRDRPSRAVTEDRHAPSTEPVEAMPRIASFSGVEA